MLRNSDSSFQADGGHASAAGTAGCAGSSIQESAPVARHASGRTRTRRIVDGLGKVPLSRVLDRLSALRRNAQHPMHTSRTWLRTSWLIRWRWSDSCVPGSTTKGPTSNRVRGPGNHQGSFFSSRSIVPVFSTKPSLFSEFLVLFPGHPAFGSAGTQFLFSGSKYSIGDANHTETCPPASTMPVFHVLWASAA